ncbi:hypothetical protein [Qaidamihabitans albus]|uniref:hypothetical protein n=1 Tax=Qaidamihabitans albus TaxID=2795733 RepID=UPI0018F1E932|nr:hypothetical protein [Qaidamihabitans albus]
MRTSDELIVYLDTIRTHLIAHRLPAPVGVSAAVWKGCVQVQLAGLDLPELAGELVAWARTLHGPTAEIVRTSDGKRVLLTVVGRLASGLVVHAWGAVRFDAVTFPDLPIAVEQEVAVAALHGWAASKGVAA